MLYTNQSRPHAAARAQLFPDPQRTASSGQAATLLARPADKGTSERYISYQDVALATSLLIYLGMWSLGD